jgi:hypothetical protein
MNDLVTAAGASGSPGRQAVEPGWSGSAPPRVAALARRRRPAGP